MRIWKPWFVYRPAQVLRRVLLPASRPGLQWLDTSWGVPVLADPARTIGRSILTTGVHDLAVSEAISRLIDPGAVVVDAGANVGYMTVLASVAAGPAGRVLAFEPHPDLFACLERNVDAARRAFAVAPVELHNVALGERPGTAALLVPAGFEANDGVARVVESPAADGRTVPVTVNALDALLDDVPVSVLKLDVEGFEIHVLRGAARALASRRLTHIVFEDHEAPNSEVVRLLESAGYRIFALGWTMRGLTLSPADRGSLASSYEAPNYVASLDPDGVARRCAPRGWRVLRRMARRA